MKLFFFFGDSITLGVNDPQGGGWVGRFAMRSTEMQGMPIPPTTFYNLGVRKQSSKAVSSRWEAEYMQRRIENASPHLIFCFGTVDMAAPSGIPVMSVEDSTVTARDILQRAKDEAPVLLMSPPPVLQTAHRERIGVLSAAYAELCNAISIPHLNLFELLRSSDAFMNDLSDGVHPGALGNSLIADLLLNFPPMQEWMQS